MNDRGEVQRPPSPPLCGEFGARLAAASGPALIIAPGPAWLVAANAAGANLLGLAGAFEGREIPLDSAMPAIMDLRRTIARGLSGNATPTPLVFWTPEGIARLPCHVEISARLDTHSLALVEVVVGETRASAGSAAQTQTEAPRPANGLDTQGGSAGDTVVTHQPTAPVRIELPSRTEQPEHPRADAQRLDRNDATAHPPTATGPAAHAGRPTEKVGPAPHAPSPPNTNMGAPTRAPVGPHPAAPPASRNAARDRPRSNAAAPRKSTPAHAPEPATLTTGAAPPPPPPQHRSDDETLKAIARQILAGKRAASAHAKPTPATAQTGSSDRLARTTGATRAAAAHSSSRDVRRAEVPPDRTENARTVDTASEDADQRPDEPRPSGARRALIQRMAHELKTPISAIASAAEIMKDQRLGPIGDQRYLRYAHDIHESARHALAVIERMLGQRQAEAGEAQMSFTNLDLNALSAALLSGLETMAQEAGLALEAALAKRLPLVVADATSIRQIVLNLLTNALKFTPRGGRVRLATAIDENRLLTLTIADTGPGMSKTEISRILEGGRAGGDVESTSPAPRRSGGLGIGLPLAHKLAAANGATLDIVCPTEGGTHVTLAFPPSRQVPV